MPVYSRNYRELTTIRLMPDKRVLFYGTELTLEFKPQVGDTFRIKALSEQWQQFRVAKVVRTLEQISEDDATVWEYESQIWVVKDE